MDGMTESSTVPLEAVQPETEFAEFYLGIISNLHDLNNRQILNNVKSALRDIILRKYETENLHKKTCSSFKRPQVRCAYLYAYSVLHSIMVYSEFSNLINQSKMYFLSACRRDSLKICCLGGGPGIETVAICRSMYDIILKPYLASHKSLSVQVTMIDKLPHWRREESAVVNAINDSSNVLHSNRIILHSDFMKADLSKPFEKNVREKIKEADIVTFVRLALSTEENSSESCDGEQLMMENIIESMQEGSCLFMLDAAGGKVFNDMVTFLKDKGPHSRLKTSMHKEYNLGVRTINKFEHILKLKNDSNYRPVRPTMKGKVCACMWVKSISVLSDNNDFQKKNKVGKTKNVTNTTVQSEKDVSSATHSIGDQKISNGDIVTPTNNAQNTEPVKKSKRPMKEKMKRKINKQTLSMIVTMIVLSMILRGRPAVMD